MLDRRQSDDDQSVKHYLSALGGPAVAIFDIGTRGTRLILGPKDPPQTIDSKTFKIVGHKPNLGLDVDAETRRLPANAKSLEFVIEFVKRNVAILAEHNVSERHVITTAWFRWLENKDEIRTLFRQRTGLDIESITQQRESQLSLLSLPVLMERWQGHNSPPKINDEDTVAILDQGGGSLEFSWMRWGDRNNQKIDIEMAAFPTLGTVALRRDFFHLRKNLLSRSRPQDNKTFIKHQVERIRKKARNAIRSNPELPIANPKTPGKLHLFGLGSGISKVIDAGIHARHNKFLTPDRLRERLNENLTILDANREQVRSIWRGMYAPRNKQTEASMKWHDRQSELDELLTSLFGIPVYEEAIAVTKCPGINLSGYGLGFGYYFDRYLNGPTPKQANQDDRGPYVFVSYCRDDLEEVEQELDLFREMKIRLWYDVNAHGSFAKQISEKIRLSAAVVVFITKNSIKSDWVGKEIALADQFGRRIVPIFLDDSALPSGIDLYLARRDHIKRIQLTEDRYRLKVENSIPAKCRLRKAR